MPIPFNCPSCQRRGAAKDHLAGKQVRCPGCGGAIPITVMPVAADPPDSDPIFEAPVATPAVAGPRPWLVITSLILAAVGLVTSIALAVVIIAGRPGADPRAATGVASDSSLSAPLPAPKFKIQLDSPASAAKNDIGFFLERDFAIGEVGTMPLLSPPSAAGALWVITYRAGQILGDDAMVVNVDIDISSTQITGGKLVANKHSKKYEFVLDGVYTSGLADGSTLSYQVVARRFSVVGTTKVGARTLYVLRPAI